MQLALVRVAAITEHAKNRHPVQHRMKGRRLDGNRPYPAELFGSTNGRFVTCSTRDINDCRGWERTCIALMIEGWPPPTVLTPTFALCNGEVPSIKDQKGTLVAAPTSRHWCCAGFDNYFASAWELPIF